MDVTSLFNTLMIVSTLVIITNEWVSGYTKVDGSLSRIQSWLISIILCIFATWINIGVFSEMDWKGGVVMGIISALVANGIFTIESIKDILETIKVRTFIPEK